MINGCSKDVAVFDFLGGLHIWRFASDMEGLTMLFVVWRGQKLRQKV